jgi:formate dehydrogenase major subunit
MSQEPWTLFWPRSGFTPAPGLPKLTGCDPAEVRAAARLYAKGGAAAIYYGLGVTEHKPWLCSVTPSP